MHIKRSIAGVIAVAAVGVFGSTLAHAMWFAPQEPEVLLSEAVISPQTRSASPEEYPARLIIPKLKVDANVQHVGITAKNTMAVPSNYSDAGWYRHGTLPGNLGSAVMDGHVDNGFGLAGVFKRLEELEEGDDIYVEAKNGTRLHFVVEEIALYAYEDAPLEKIFNRSDAARLNLITCGGDWLPEAKTYDHRLVVYARLEL